MQYLPSNKSDGIRIRIPWSPKTNGRDHTIERAGTSSTTSVALKSLQLSPLSLNLYALGRAKGLIPDFVVNRERVHIGCDPGRHDCVDIQNGIRQTALSKPVEHISLLHHAKHSRWTCSRLRSSTHPLVRCLQNLLSSRLRGVTGIPDLPDNQTFSSV